MKTSPHLLVYVSAHGFGHVAQVAPVLNALGERLPGLRVTLCSAVSATHLKSRIAIEFHHVLKAVDFGLVMASAIDVLIEPSMQAYRDFHHDWDMRVVDEAHYISELAPDFVLSDVAYLPLAAAYRAGIPCAAMCSLNWADIFKHYFLSLPDAIHIHQQMLDAYELADAWLRVTPGMPMADLSNVRVVGPIARIGQNLRPEINAKLGFHGHERLVLVTLGGIASRLPMEKWPRLPGVRWLVQADWGITHPDAFTIESLGMDFTDVLASSDALLCKPGYGSFAEAACNGVPVLYIGRPDWPEQPCLVDWLEVHGRCLEVGRADLARGTVTEALEALLALPRPEPVHPDGIEEITDYLANRLA